MRKVGSSDTPPPHCAARGSRSRRRSRELEGASMPKHARDDGTCFRLEIPVPGLGRGRPNHPTATTHSTAPAAAPATTALVERRRARFRANARKSAHSSTDPFDARPYPLSPPPLPRGAQTATPRGTNAGPTRSVFRLLMRRGKRLKRNDDARRNPRCLWMRFPEPSGARTTNASC